jgi:hypothetical protein
MCCGAKRPRGKAVKLVVKPTMSGNEFVTVHDYLSAVPPWLMSARGDILWCMGLGDGKLLPPRDGTHGNLHWETYVNDIS